MTLRFLLLDDNQEDASVIKVTLTSGAIDCELMRVETCSEFVTALDSNIFDLILADYAVSGFDGLSALKIARNKSPDVPFIFVSSSLDEELEIELLKSGATDYLLKQRLGCLVSRVQRALREAKERSKLQRSNLALHESEARLRAIAANLPNAAVFIVDNNLRYLLAEGQALLGAGISSFGLVGKTLWEALDPETATYYEPYFRQALGGESFSLEHYTHGRYYISHGTPLYNDQGEIDAVLAVSYDNTIRKRAELNAEFLTTVSQVLVSATSVEEIVQTIGEQLNSYLNTSICAFVEINEGAQEAVINHDWHLNDMPSLIGFYSLREFVTDEYLQIAQSGQPIVVRDVALDPRIANAFRFAALKIGAELNIPLIKDGEWKFSLTVFHQAPYNWRPDEIDLMQELANRVWSKLERARAEAALLQSESRLRLMVESAKEYAIFTLSLDGIITSWNSGAERLLGYHETEIIGCSSRIIFTPEDNEILQAEREMQIALTQGKAENERWHVRKDGSRFWASGLTMPLLSEAGCVEGFVEILQDKTAQRQADARLQLLYEMTRDLLATPQPMQLMSNLFNRLSAHLQLDYYYNYMVEKKDNQLMLHLKNYGGISEADAQSIEWIEFGQHLCGLSAQQRRQIVLDQTQIATLPNAQLIRSMGITAYAGQLLIVQGRLLGTLSFASRTRTSFTPEEIDLLQSACEQIAIAIERANLIASMEQQAEQLQQANRIKDEFLAVLSHELRSPLNPILGWSTLLKTGKLDAAKTAQGLTVIERNAKLQSELIEDLLDVSRILQGKLSLNVATVDLAPTIQAAMETVQLAAQAKSIQIQANLEPNIGQVSGDANRLQQIIWNLLSNAVKFTDIGGKVDIELRRLDMSAQIKVKDTGKGINPEFLPYVFDHFRQEDGAITRRFGGLGLGLAIVRHLVELHGGTVCAESPGEGQGATFTVTLPLIQNVSQTNPDSKPSELSLNLDGINVLVVDDDTDTREFIAFMLSMYGANVTTAHCGAEALMILAKNRTCVLVSDIGMPDMDGYVLMQQLRALPTEQGGQIPAIALTAYAGEINQKQALLAGFQRHMSKPVEPTTLITAIAQLSQKITNFC